jgi:hypothetical protein
MSKQSGSAGTPSGGGGDEEPTILGVEDIPGAVSPDAVGAAGGGRGGSGGQSGLNERLAAFRERRAAQGPGGGAGPGAGGGGAQRRGGGMGRGQGMGMGRGGGGAQGLRGQGGQGGGRPNADEDPIAAGKRVLEQFNARLADAGDDKRPMQNAMRSVTRGYEALEKEVERLRHELERAHEAIRTVQRQGD